MAYEDKQLTCKDCGQEFEFTAREQEFYAEKGFENEPGRCPACRSARKANRGNDRRQRQFYKATCADCGQETEVPFQPTGERPVYCRDCFEKRR